MQKEDNDLAVRTKSFALQIIRLFSGLPKTTEAQVMGKQVLRSGTSVGAKCGDCLREIEETAYWLDLLADAGVIAPEKLASIRQECGELIAIFVTILKRSKENLS